VLDLSGGAPVFGLLWEWLQLNRVPTLQIPGEEESGDPAATSFAPGITRFLEEAASDLAGWWALPPRGPEWADAGWDQVQDLLRGAAARDPAPTAQSGSHAGWASPRLLDTSVPGTPPDSEIRRQAAPASGE
jgi:hypothetical protein